MYKIIKTLMYDRVHKGSYICDAQRKGWGLGGGGALKFAMCLRILLFLSNVCFSFLQMGVTELVMFCSHFCKFVANRKVWIGVIHI